jgi:hypothetical protein
MGNCPRLPRPNESGPKLLNQGGENRSVSSWLCWGPTMRILSDSPEASPMPEYLQNPIIKARIMIDKCISFCYIGNGGSENGKKTGPI